MTASTRKLLVPICVSVLSGLVVSAQVYLARRPATLDASRRALKALRSLPAGHRIHPRDFAIELAPVTGRPDLIESDSGVWGRELSQALDVGDWLTHEAVSAMQEPMRHKRARPAELIQETGDG